MTRQVVFVCLHGAAKSRMAAAFFNRAPPPGWEASSAGVEPQAEVSQRAIRLLAGTDAADWLDLSPPVPLTAPAPVDRLVAIDCQVVGADEWRLAHQEYDEAMREELRTRVLALVAALRQES